MNTSEYTPERTAVQSQGRAAHELRATRMSPLKRFARLGVKRQVLLLRTLFLVSAIRVGLWVLPFRFLQRFVQREHRKTNIVHSVSDYVRAVRAVSRYVPGATCLTQALATQALLMQSGLESRIEIGVRKDEQSGFMAHAWVIYEGRIIIGGSEADDYLPLKNAQQNLR